MISYKPFWDMLAERGISTYALENKYNIGRSLIDKLKHDKGLTTATIDRLCETFECQVNDIMIYVKE